ncbi:ribonuclease HI [Halovivax sp.]|uniref:ribonuclease HI n=1 Tax=Halovivax sp. TaxID=1935978 RepID=UPI0025BCB005|nr:reverse transcriptase-like protein [Halovivax sp.]
MAAHGHRSPLRNRFDDAPAPATYYRPDTHHRDFYVATDGSFRPTTGDGGLGVVIETGDGERVLRTALPAHVPDNNAAEYRALHLGLDILADRAPPDARIGVLVDHDELAANVNTAAAAGHLSSRRVPVGVRVSPRNRFHWRGIRARIAGFSEVRAACLDGAENPAHRLANVPEEYVHLRDRPAKCVLPPRRFPTPPTAGIESEASD